MRQLLKCGDCGHYGHTPGKRCPLHRLLADERATQLEVSRMFPDKPELHALLRMVQASWAAKLRGSLRV